MDGSLTAMRLAGRYAIAITVKTFMVRDSRFASCAATFKLWFCALLVLASSIASLL
jgi:hypothetical protein